MAEEIELLEADETELLRLGLKFFLKGGPPRAKASPPPPNLLLRLPGLELRELLSSVSKNFLLSALELLLGLAMGIFLASVMGVPPEESLSRVDSISLALVDSCAGGEEDGPGELWGEEGAVLGREEGGGGG